jgi:hypothetical protein
MIEIFAPSWTAPALDLPFGGPGAHDLEMYLRRGNGDALLRAYLRQREADGPRWQARFEELIGQVGQPKPLDSTNDSAELKMLCTLYCLDALVRDLLRFCEHPGPQNSQLEALRKALRIDRGHSAHDVHVARRRDRALSRWQAAYRDMARTGVVRSDRAIAIDIAKKLPITSRAVLGYWQQLKKDDPSIEDMAKALRLIAEHSSPTQRSAVRQRQPRRDAAL